MQPYAAVSLVIAAAMAVVAREGGDGSHTFVQWRTGAVVYTSPDACYVGSTTQGASEAGDPLKLYPEQLLLPHEVEQLNSELGTGCKTNTSWWLTTTPPQLPTLADYLLQYAVNKTKFSGSKERKVPRVRRSSRSGTNPSTRLRQRLHELTQRLAPGADWKTTGVVERRGRVQLTDDPYPSPLFSRQPNGKRFKHYKAFYDEIARQVNANAHSSGAASENASPQRNSIQSYSLRIRNQPSSNVRLKSRDGQPLRRRIPRNRFRSRQYSHENSGRNQLSTNDKRNANDENYEFSETEYHASTTDNSESNFASVPQNLIASRSQEYNEDNEFVDQRETETYESGSGAPENSLVFSQAHGSAGPHGSFQAESQSVGQAGEETRSAVDGGQHGASASSSAVRFDQQALAHVQVSPSSSGQSQPQEHSEESLNGSPAAVSASEIEDMMRRNGFTGFAMATVSSRKKERGRNKVKPLTSLGLSVPGYSDDAIPHDQVNGVNDADLNEHDSVIIDQGGLVGGAGDYHHESEFQQINQAEIPEGGLESDLNGGSVGLATYTQGVPGYSPENDYSDEYYDFERYNHNPPLYFPEDYSSFDDPSSIDDSHFRNVDGSGHFWSENQYQPDSVPSPDHQNTPEDVSSYAYEQREPNGRDEMQSNFRYEEGIPYGQDIISYHETGDLYNPNEVLPDANEVQDGNYDRSHVDESSSSLPYTRTNGHSFDQAGPNGQGNQIGYNVGNREESPQITDENIDITSSNRIPNNVNGNGMMIIDDSLQSYFFQPPDVNVPTSQQTDRYPNPDLVLDYDVHSRRTDLPSSYNSYDQTGLLGGLPVIEHVAQPVPVSTDDSTDRVSFDSSTSSDHFISAEGSFPPLARDNEIQDQHAQGIPSRDSYKNGQQHGNIVHESAQDVSPDRTLGNVPLYYPPGYSDRQPASQGVDNTFSSHPSHYGGHFAPTEAIPSLQQNIPYDNRRELEAAAPNVRDSGLDDYTYANESEALDYEPDDYTVEIPSSYNTSHSVYSTTHHYGYQRGSSERGIGSTSNTVLLPAVPPPAPSFSSVSQTPQAAGSQPELTPSMPFPQSSSTPGSPSDTRQSQAPVSENTETMRVLTPGGVGSMQSLPAADPNLANVRVVMAEAPNPAEINQRVGKIWFSGEKIPGTTGYLIPPGFRGRLVLGNIGVTSSSQAEMMPGLNSQNVNSMHGMQMRVSSSSSATSTGSGVSLSSSSSSDASPRGLVSSSSSSASNPQGQQTSYNSYNQPVYSYQQTFNSRGNGGLTNGGRPNNPQLNWQPSSQNHQGMRSKSWSSWRTSSWSSDNSQPGSPSSGQYFSQSALQPTARDCGYWSMRCNMVFGPYKQNEICQPTHVILPCCC